MSNIETIEYKEFIKRIKTKVQQAQIKASIKVNVELLKFYWELGEEIIEKQKSASWGSGFLQQINKDLTTSFPDIKGFSLSNIQYIRRWVLFYTKSGTSCATFTSNLIIQGCSPRLHRFNIYPFSFVGVFMGKHPTKLFFLPIFIRGALKTAPLYNQKFENYINNGI